MCKASSSIRPPLLDLKDSALNYELLPKRRGAADAPSRHRFWDAAAVESSRAVQGDSGRMLRFLRKLYAGEAVTVAAVGSSVVKDCSGCFGPPDVLQREDAESWSGLVRRNARSCPHSGGDADGAGYMTHFMRVLNATWPHPDHLYLNVGKGGTTANGWSAMCLHHVLPEAMDLVVLEQYTLHSKAPHFEFLLRAVLQWPSQPAVVAYNHRTKNLSQRKAFASCYHELWKDLPDAITEPAACRSPEGPDKEWLGLDVVKLRSDPPLVEYHELAAHYGVPSVSLGHLLAEITERGLAVEAGLRPVHLHALLYDEYLIHPTRLHGATAVADMLLEVLLSADRDMRALCETSPGAALEEAAPLPKKKHRKTRNQYLQQQCFEAGLPGSRVDTQLMDVAVSEGFRFLETTGHGDKHKRKPGFVADGADARLDVRLPTSFPRFPHHKVEIAVTYLKSYEHMGKAQLECTGGCSCDPVTVDAHTKVQQSANEVCTLRVTPGPHCLLRTTILDETSSGEHKFKVEQVAVQVS